ncbi:hypothetical protein IT575_13565 [bacterium]|nr:hypothetical protein [bacterium]
MLPSQTEGFNCALYRFAGLTDDDAPFVIGVDLLEPLPQSFWIGYSDYSKEAWQWTRVSNPQLHLDLAITGEAQARSAEGNVYVVLAAQSAGALSIDQLSLELDALCPPPQAPTASQGDHHDRISLSWEALELQHPGITYDAILIERAASAGGPYASLAQLAPDSTAYEDIHEGSGAGQNDMGGAAPLFYRLRLQRLGAVSVPSLANSGYRELSNVPTLIASNGTSTGLGDRVSLSWEAVPGADSYELEYRGNDGGSPAAFTSLISLGQQLSYDHLPGSPPGKGCDSHFAYRYRIRASGLGLTSPAWREAVGSRRLDTPILLPSQGTDPDGVLLNWEAVPGASGYRIYHSANADLLADVPDNEPYLHAVSDFELHDYIMVAYCNSNNSVYSGWTNGYRQGWQSHIPGFGIGSASSMVITASGQPLVAAREGEELRLYLADSAAPNSSDDWTSYGWYGPLNLSPALAMLNGKPVMFNGYLLGGVSTIWFERSSQAVPDSADDWIGYLIAGIDGEISGALSPLVIGLRPMAALQANDSLHLYCATVDEPLDTALWTSYTLDAELGIAGNSRPALFDLSGRPALVYESAAKVYYGRSAVAAPELGTDWSFHEVFDTSSFDAFGALSGFDAIDAGGYPAFAFSGVSSVELRLAIASAQEPTQGSNWTYSYVGNRGLACVAHEIALAQVGSGLQIL